MSSFSEYMDEIRAEKELKDKTEAFVRSALSEGKGKDNVSDFGSELKKERTFRKKLLITASSLAACIVLAIGFNAFYQMPVNFLCMDINPSVEFGINTFGRVVTAQAYNEDGSYLIEDDWYSNLKAEDAVSSLIEEVIKHGYIAEDGTTVIALTAESNSYESAEELQNIGEKSAAVALNSSEISAIIYSDCSDLKLRNQASETGVSAGKLKLIHILQALDSSISVEEYENAKIRDIIIEVNKLLSEQDDSYWQNGNSSETLKRIRFAAQQVQAVCKYAEQGLEENESPIQGPKQAEESQQQVQNQGSDFGQQQNHGSSNSYSSQNHEQATAPAPSKDEITRKRNY